ncbi:hypothetical protein H0E87_020509 [Populus deltoides]|uniref:Protein kinase domain-containing protein n=1 Tax=Populus deltoides TaxID=3696 RepID=A0A8T2XJQ5_POPDE|nr:hypothetical protein H0E87_020509 [Populus deltoides]
MEFVSAPGAARGLEYLHEGMAPNIVHGCFKASNILLDDKLCARVSDYGLSSLAPYEKRGLAGYVDDEHWRNGRGRLARKLLSGRRAEEGLLVRWALPLIKQMRFSELLDLRLVMPSDMRPIIRLAKVASACVSNSRKSRPTIVQVATILNNLEIEVCLIAMAYYEEKVNF